MMSELKKKKKADEESREDDAVAGQNEKGRRKTLSATERSRSFSLPWRIPFYMHVKH